MAESATSSFTLDPDDFCLALFSEEESLPISDERYAAELQLQEVIMSSLISACLLQPHQTSIILSKDKASPKEADKVFICETGESSGIFCQICMEGKAEEEMFRNDKCAHVFCSDCISKHVAAKIEQNMTKVECPDLECKGLLEPEFCRKVIPDEVLERWESALCEWMVLESQRFYCPFKDCSALLADDGGVDVTQSECPNCHRLFCAKCMVPWHSGFECEEYQNLNEDEKGTDDLLAMELAKKSKWRRCPRCKFYVEKNTGCQHIVCRCGNEFCYGCGSAWNDHDGCAPR